MIKVESNGASIQTTTVESLPSNVHVLARMMRRVDNDASPPESLQKASSSKCLNGKTPVVMMSKPLAHPNIQALCNNSCNFPDLHDRSDYGKHSQQQAKSTGVEHSIELIRSAEAKQLSRGERLKEGTCRERFLKEICQGFEDEPYDAFYGDGNGFLPHFILGMCSPRRNDGCQDAHGFRRSEICNIPLSLDIELYERPEQDHDNGYQQSLSNLRREHFGPYYFARPDRYRVKDLHLGKRKISCQDQLLGFAGHIGGFEDHGYNDERDMVDCMYSAVSESEQETSFINFKRKRAQSPVYDYRWDAEGENAEISPACSPPMCVTRYGGRSKPYCCEDEWCRCHPESDRGRLLRRPGIGSNAVGCFQIEREAHSGSGLYVACPTIKDRILWASGSDRGQVVEAV